jgi:hypothetical protein
MGTGEEMFDAGGTGYVRYDTTAGCDQHPELQSGSLGVHVRGVRADGFICRDTGWQYNVGSSSSWLAYWFSNCSFNNIQTQTKGTVYRAHFGDYVTDGTWTASPFVS